MIFYPGIFDDKNLIFLENIINKFINRYDSKISSYDEKPENIAFDLSNPQRCELVIAQNFHKIFNHPFISYSSRQYKYSADLVEQYLFANLLSVFFFNEKVSFKNYYHDFKSIKFNPENDLGILVHIKSHVCCLYVCEGIEKYYNDNNKQVYNCLWKSILKKSTNLFIKKDSNFKHFDSYENIENLQKVLYLTVISKDPKNSVLDQEIENMLKNDFSSINDRELQLILGNAYNKDIGGGIAQDYAEAVRWYRLAADQGNVTAQFNVGVMFYNGTGVAQDYTEAMRWYRLAADQGHALAQYYLGLMFQHSLGVKKDNVEAVRWYRLAADQGHADAQANLGVVEEKAEAERLYLLAVNQGHADAQYKLGLMLINGEGVAKDNEEAMIWFHLAADQGHVDAQYVLGSMLSNREGVEKDYEEAMIWFRLAADQGNVLAYYELGMMFMNGKGVEKDNAEAMKWFRLAADQGYKQAIFLLNHLLKD